MLLHRWVQAECSSLGDMDAPEVNPILHKAAQALRERQILFKYCAEEVTTARHNAMFQRYAAPMSLHCSALDVTRSGQQNVSH